jgi:P27 family predicted phage terminase small subunit
MAGRKRIPTKLKILEGNPGKRRLPEHEPDPPASLPDPPGHLDYRALEEWNRVAPGLCALGLLSDMDRATLAAYCVSYSIWARATQKMKTERLTKETEKGFIVQNPLIGIANKAAADMVKYATEFGMAPAARARLGISHEGKKKGKFDGLMGIDGGKK